MRVALCQTNTTVGDLEGNLGRIVEAAQRALEQGAKLAVYPELVLCGYPPADLLDRRGFIDDNLAAIGQLVSALPPGIAALVGFVECEEDEAGHSLLHNSVGLIRDGELAQVFRKRLLPSYDVFDETRYFSPGYSPLTFTHQGVCFGVTICEDAWNAVEGPLRSRYPHDPIAACVEEGAEVIVNVAASPFTLTKHVARDDMMARIARKHRCPVVLVNLAGANDDLIFDGNSAIYSAQGQRTAACGRFEQDLCVSDTEAGDPVEADYASPESAVLDALILGTRDYARKCGFTKAVLGLSGGIDSALVACVAAEALGPDRVLGVAMPTRYSSKGSLDDAQALASALGIEYRVIDIDPMFQSYIDGLRPHLEELGPAPANDTTYENFQARIRGNTVMGISNRLGHLLLTTGNKSEVAVGYCTLYGDMAGGLAVISDLPKTFVYDVSREVNHRAGRELIPMSILTKPPSAELRPDQTDQDSLPSYELLDAILERLVERGMAVADIVTEGYEADVVQRIAGLVRTSEYKRRQMPPGLIVTSKAFGPGRRMPIAQRYRR